MSAQLNAGMDRQKYIGGSDVAAILGISPWKTPLDVYLDKSQPRVETVDPARQRLFTRGQRMEPYVIDLLAEEEGICIVARGNRYIDPELPFVAAEIDAECRRLAPTASATVQRPTLPIPASRSRSAWR
jgi:predicted phage-related endonuclease